LALFWAVGFLSGPGGAQSAPPAVQVTTTTLTIDTYPFAPYLTMHHSDAYNIDYPYLDWTAYEASNPQPLPHDYAALVVENPWLRLTFLPELGGRLYGLTVKATGEQLLYQNPVIKPTDWGPPEQGWWLAAGGVEWCLPVDEHGYEWGVPWDYEVLTATAGVTVTLWDSDAPDRLRARISVFLPADRAAFQVSPRLENPTATSLAFKFWHNAMLAPGAANTVGPDLSFVLPLDQVTVHSRGDDQLPGPGQAMDWPVYDGIDYSRLGNWNRWLGFFARPQAQAGWAGIYDVAARRGLARTFDPQVAVGVKGFAFGWGDPIPSTRWTDDGSTYVELHGGPSPTFWDTITLDPGQSLAWTETWLPLRDLPALSVAANEVALGLDAEGTDLHLGLVSARPQSALDLRLYRQAGCELLWQQSGLYLEAGQPYLQELVGLGLDAAEVLLVAFDGAQPLVATGDLVCWPPLSAVAPLPTVQPATDFEVHWTGTDTGGGLDGYDVQVRDGDAGATWADWLTGTMITSASFHGQDGHTYTFRSRARDTFGNVEAWPANDWQDAFTTVLLSPAPVLITSAKVAQPLAVQPGDQLEYQVHLRNTGNLTATVRITDALLPSLELVAGPWSNVGPQPIAISDTIYWSGTVAADLVAIGFEARLREPPWVAGGQTVTNTVWIADGLHPVLSRQVAVAVNVRFYLPLVLKSTD
jgi:uncharacterized repeat protein (TIGR01451 family)